MRACSSGLERKRRIRNAMQLFSPCYYKYTIHQNNRRIKKRKKGRRRRRGSPEQHLLLRTTYTTLEEPSRHALPFDNRVVWKARKLNWHSPRPYNRLSRLWRHSKPFTSTTALQIYSYRIRAQFGITTTTTTTATTTTLASACQ